LPALEFTRDCVVPGLIKGLLVPGRSQVRGLTVADTMLDWRDAQNIPKIKQSLSLVSRCRFSSKIKIFLPLE